MSDCILQASGVKMSYRNKPVLSGLNFAVKRGEICGLLGPNGAGKTTLLKILTGLIRPDQGEVQLFGKPFQPSALRRVGSIIDKPSLYSGKTAVENLRIQQMLLGVPDDRVEQALRQVGLWDAAGRKAGKLSAGMRQRLGIAMALLGNPELLILDEPVNSLDTLGMYEMRTLFQSLHEERGVTILITSHLLDEVSRMATSYAILKEGRAEQYSAAQVRDHSREYAEIITPDPAAALPVMDAFVEEGGYEALPDGSIRLYQSLDRLPEINAALVRAGVPVQSMTTKARTLADFYLDQTGRGDLRA